MSRRAALIVLVALVALAAAGCGRKAKPEPLWSAARVNVITDRSR